MTTANEEVERKKSSCWNILYDRLSWRDWEKSRYFYLTWEMHDYVLLYFFLTLTYKEFVTHL